MDRPVRLQVEQRPPHREHRRQLHRHRRVLVGRLLRLRVLQLLRWQRLRRRSLRILHVLERIPGEKKRERAREEEKMRPFFFKFRLSSSSSLTPRRRPSFPLLILFASKTVHRHGPVPGLERRRVHPDGEFGGGFEATSIIFFGAKSSREGGGRAPSGVVDDPLSLSHKHTLDRSFSSFFFSEKKTDVLHVHVLRPVVRLLHLRPAVRLVERREMKRSVRRGSAVLRGVGVVSASLSRGDVSFPLLSRPRAARSLSLCSSLFLFRDCLFTHMSYKKKCFSPFLHPLADRVFGRRQRERERAPSRALSFSLPLDNDDDDSPPPPPPIFPLSSLPSLTARASPSEGARGRHEDLLINATTTNEKKEKDVERRKKKKGAGLLGVFFSRFQKLAFVNRKMMRRRSR